MASSDSEGSSKRRSRDRSSRSGSRSHKSKRDRSRSRDKHRKDRHKRSKDRKRSDSPQRKQAKTGSTAKAILAAKEKMRRDLADAGATEMLIKTEPTTSTATVSSEQILKVADRHREIERIESEGTFKPASFMSFRSGNAPVLDEDVADDAEIQSAHESAIFGTMGPEEKPKPKESKIDDAAVTRNVPLAHENLQPSAEREAKWLERWKIMRQNVLEGRPPMENIIITPN